MNKSMALHTRQRFYVRKRFVDKYSYSGYGIRFENYGTFMLCNGSGFGKNVMILVLT